MVASGDSNPRPLGPEHPADTPRDPMSDLDQLCQWTSNNRMLFNDSKCLAMHITFCRNYPPLPPLRVNNTPLAVAPSLKTLGLHIQNNLHWDVQVKQIVGKAAKKLYLLKRLKRFMLSRDDLITIYTCYTRPILEYAAPAWTSGLTKVQTEKLEQIQKRACRIILGNDYTGYSPPPLQQLGLTTLAQRRESVMESNFLNCAIDII
ncbi:uncharacterized protein [Branchiostoma lanceolatum]|uniref:uncharacterized protein n=1 Tax=Branchiostoma lanceolatum TaxID=7740 RepID=UPI003454C273